MRTRYQLPRHTSGTRPSDERPSTEPRRSAAQDALGKFRIRYGSSEGSSDRRAPVATAAMALALAAQLEQVR